jgi:DNA-binding CsgD family transcriptional regulator
MRKADYILLTAGMAFMWPFMTVVIQVHYWTLLDVDANSGGLASGSPVLANLTFGNPAVDYSLVLALLFIAIFILRGKLSGLIANNKVFLGITAILGSTGVLLLTAPNLFGGASHWTALLGMFLLALFVAVYFVAWGIRSSQGDIRCLLICILVASIICRLLTGFYYLAGIDQSGFYVIRPFASGLFLLLLPNASANLGSSSVRALKVGPWTTFIPVVLLSLFTSIMVQLLPESRVGDMPSLNHVINALLVMVVAGAMALFVFYRLRSIDDLLLVFACFFIFCSAILLTIYLFPSLYTYSLVIRICLVMFLWVVFAYTVSMQRLSPMILFPILGCFVIAGLGLRMFDYVGLAAAIQGSSLATAVLAILMFLAVCAVLITLVVRHLKAKKQPPLVKDFSQQELCERATRDAELTSRELEVVLLASRGYSGKKIAESLFLSEQTVKNHLSSIYRKLGLHSKQGLINLIDSYR